MNLTHFEASGGPLCGVHVVDAEASLRHGLLTGFGTGLCLHGTSADPNAIAADIRLRDNGSLLSTERLPLPDIAAPIGDIADP
jgi:hypothetical protein